MSIYGIKYNEYNPVDKGATIKPHKNARKHRCFTNRDDTEIKMDTNKGIKKFILEDPYSYFQHISQNNTYVH
jgi:hypothetical protein